MRFVVPVFVAFLGGKDKAKMRKQRIAFKSKAMGLVILYKWRGSPGSCRPKSLKEISYIKKNHVLNNTHLVKKVNILEKRDKFRKGLNLVEKFTTFFLICRSSVMKNLKKIFVLSLCALCTNNALSITLPSEGTEEEGNTAQGTARLWKPNHARAFTPSSKYLKTYESNWTKRAVLMPGHVFMDILREARESGLDEYEHIAPASYAVGAIPLIAFCSTFIKCSNRRFGVASFGLMASLAAMYWLDARYNEVVSESRDKTFRWNNLYRVIDKGATRSVAVKFSKAQAIGEGVRVGFYESGGWLWRRAAPFTDERVVLDLIWSDPKASTQGTEDTEEGETAKSEAS